MSIRAQMTATCLVFDSSTLPICLRFTLLYLQACGFKSCL